MPVSAAASSFSNAMSAMWEKLLSKRLGNRRRPRGDAGSSPCPAAPRCGSPGCGLLPLRAVAGLGGLLGRAPPGLVGHVPVDGGLQALGEVGVGRPPAELALELGAVDGVAAVVAGAVGDPVEVLGVAPHGREDHAQHGDVVLLAVRADEVGLPHAALGEDVPHGRGVVLGVNPVADVLAAAVELGAHAVDDVRDLPGDELLHVLVGAVVVGAVGDRGAKAVGAGPCADQHVGAGLGGAIGRGRPVRRLLGELGRVVERQVAVHLVGGDVVVADSVFAHGLQQAEGALDVGAQERLGVGDGVVVVGLGGVVHDGVVARDDLIEQLCVADVAHDELHAVGGKPGDVLGVAGVGQLVQDGDVDVRVVVHHVVHEVAADEAAAPRDDDVPGFKNLRHYSPYLRSLLIKARHKLLLGMDKLKRFVLAICGRTTDGNELKIRGAKTTLHPSHHLDKLLAWFNGHHQRTLFRKPLSNQIAHQPTPF